MLVHAGRHSDDRLLVDLLFLVSKLKENQSASDLQPWAAGPLVVEAEAPV